MQPVVASDKEKAKQRFAVLFNEELTRIGAPAARGRIVWVYKELKRTNKGRELVTQQQVRKWVRGIDMPDQTNLRIVCERLKLDWAKLAGEGETIANPLWAAMTDAWQAMPNDQLRQEIVNFARFRLGQSEQSGESDSSQNENSRT